MACGLWRANADGGVGFHWRWQSATTVPRPPPGTWHNYTFVLHSDSDLDLDAMRIRIPGAVAVPLPAGQPASPGRETHISRTDGWMSVCVWVSGQLSHEAGIVSFVLPPIVCHLKAIGI